MKGEFNVHINGDLFHRKAYKINLYGAKKKKERKSEKKAQINYQTPNEINYTHTHIAKLLVEVNMFI